MELFNEFLSDCVKFHFTEVNDPLLLTSLDHHGDIIQKFVSDPTVKVLVLERSTSRDDGEDFRTSYLMRLDVGYREKASCILFRKTGNVIDTSKPLKSQVRSFFFDESAIYDEMIDLVGKFITPMFKSFVRESRRGDQDGDKLAPSVEKNLDEVEVSLLHMQQNIDIPDIELPIHPKIQEIITNAEQQGRKAVYEDLGDLVNEFSFLDELQKCVTQWIAEIQKVTLLDRDAGSGTSLQEVAFWMNMEHALRKINDKVQADGVMLTLLALKKGNRFHATVSFDSNTKLKEKTPEVNECCSLLRDLPLNEMLAAQDFDGIRNPLIVIFNGLKKVKNSKYPIARLHKFVETISRDVRTQLIKVIGPSRLLYINAADCEQIISKAEQVFEAWDTENGKLANIIRQIPKQKRDDLKFSRFVYQHLALKKRLDEIKKFRKQHEQLQVVISRVLRRPQGNAARSDSSLQNRITEANTIIPLQNAYNDVKGIDYLDLSKDGEATWSDTLLRYHEQVSRIENQLAANLRDQLGSAKRASEMFSIFSRFNALFVRPHIRSAIRDYQTKLIEQVKADINRLIKRFSDKDAEKRALEFARHRDFPDISAYVMFARSIEGQLNDSMDRVKDVLGDEWANHIEGADLREICDRFRRQLNTDAFVNEWFTKTSKRELMNNKRMFVMDRLQHGGKVELKLRVNFASDLIDITKEVQYLKSMGIRVPYKIMAVSQQIGNFYPHAVSIIEAVDTYDRTNALVDKHDGINMLVADFRRNFRSLLEEGTTLTWDSYRAEGYVNKLSASATAYQEKVNELIDILTVINADLASLATCEYSLQAIGGHLQSIQKQVDLLSYGSVCGLAAWLDKLDQEIEKKLAVRCEQAIRVWRDVLTETVTDTDIDGNIPVPKILRIFLDIRLNYQVIIVTPSLQSAQESLMQQFFAFHSIVTAQPRISCGFSKPSGTTATYRSVLSRIPLGVYEGALMAIQRVMQQVTSFVNEWIRYQSLWELQSDAIYDRIGTDLSEWTKVLVAIKKSQHSVETQETSREFKPVVIDYTRVQTKVSEKIGIWHRLVLEKFFTLLGTEMSTFYSNISRWRTELESQSLDTGATSDAVALITFVQSLKRQAKDCRDMVVRFRHGERLLNIQRMNPPGWHYAEKIEGEWSALEQILERKDISIQAQVNNLQQRIRDEDVVVEKRVDGLLDDWHKGKPIHGNRSPKEALHDLGAFEDKMMKLREDRENMVKAKNALEISDSIKYSANMDKLNVAVEELNDLKGVWNALMPVYNEVDRMKELTWLSVQPRKIRSALDGLQADLKRLPSQYRSYDSYEYARKMLFNYAKMNSIIIELKSEALKDRHWKLLMKELNVNWNLADLQLGQVWDADLLRHENGIKQVLLVAQGEMALEEFLRQVREYWQSYEIELVNYQNKTRLIRGWDDLFNKLREHMSSLAAMKLSPYYKEFAEDAVAWEDRLNKINALFDVWIDVQRLWVYLEGLFSGSADIATLLPTESNRFASASTEFLAVMRKVASGPRILDVVNMQGAQRLLERLKDMLQKIQKALGDYLERERSSFPRFYFVGDEDLLELLGNSKDIIRVMKHLKKMFAGIVAVDFKDEDSKKISAIVSREGEKVQLVNEIDLNDTPKINDWLHKVECEMQNTLARLLRQCYEHFCKFNLEDINMEDFMEWLDNYPAQIIGICGGIWWTKVVEERLSKAQNAQQVVDFVEQMLALLSDSVLKDQPAIRRKKIEMLITEFVHKRDITRQLVSNNVVSNSDFQWLQVMRFYFDAGQSDPLKCCLIKMASAEFFYGFEYLGIQEKLVQTPLTDRCYLTMTQALHARLGGSPFGPAGTGKTESVKALGHQLGRFVLVFNCDETFDFQAVGRILVGLCQVGAWGCFDEFNRLEERMLSAVSQQIQTIQESVRAGGNTPINIVSKSLTVNLNMAIFITMNPGYSGRSHLPDNLKQLFRSLAMTQPDRNLIAEVMLFSQGFRTAESLAKKIVPLFILCKEQLSNQCHYDFGLRALKYVLVSAGNIKRSQIQKLKEHGQSVFEDIGDSLPEQQVLIQSVCETLVPKLVSEDITLLYSLLQDVFPDVQYKAQQRENLRDAIVRVCDQLMLSYSAVAAERGYLWMEKVLQLYQITTLNHGLMLVGSSGSGKTMAWKVLLKALERLEKIDGVAHVIDAKAMSKDSLYGVLDANTREWTDGLFTHIIRKIIDNVRGEADKRQWIIFDGDVDPEWVENLNSVLDDNKLLTLPNGERLSIPPNVRIIFEVSDLKYATLATVSRCGMVWFPEEVVTNDMLTENYLRRLRSLRLDTDSQHSVAEILSMAQSSNASMEMSSPMDGSVTTSVMPSSQVKDEVVSRTLEIQNLCAQCISHHLNSEGLVLNTLDYAMTTVDHIMEVTRQRLLLAFFAMMNYSVRQLVTYDFNHRDFPLTSDQIETFISRSMLVNAIWAFSGDGKWKCRQLVSDFVRSSTTIALPANDTQPIIDYYVSITGDWVPWSSKVPKMEVESHRVTAGDIVVPTMDTVRHELLLNIWLSERKPLVLCGPPGSGKTMTLLSALRSLPDMDVINVNFSSSSSPELLMRTFDHYCEYRRTPNGIVLSPIQMNRWLVIFCDEINLPSPDKYGTQRVISFMRQLVEQNGFYRTSDQQWVSLERIQFVGACNPPTDPGRNPLSLRFLRHVPVVYVDYPGHVSLNQIYETFMRAVLRQTTLANFAKPMTMAMVDFYLQSQQKFTQDEQPHYVYSPRELTRWVRGISEAISPLDTLTADDLIRLWAHEALRLFHDRLVRDSERAWTEELVDCIGSSYFGGLCNVEKALERPLLFSCWLSRHYTPVTRDEIREYIKARLKTFYEEELDVQLVLFDQMVDHVLRIDRIYRQPQGHLLLIGVSGAGKTTLARFVAWINGISVFQLKVHSGYTGADFDEDIRHVLRRAGCRNERICFIMDESNMLDTAFLERLNTLLANGEVPGLFEGDEHTSLMNQIKEGAQRNGLMLDSPEELYKWFTAQVIRNLHVVFTMNPSGDGLRERASTSPALFNRCVLNWFGDWADSALYQVGDELTMKLDIHQDGYVPPMAMERVCDLLPPTIRYRDAVVNCFVQFHSVVRKVNEIEARKSHRITALTPRHFLDFIRHFTKLFFEKRHELEEERRHLNIGLTKIQETEEQVKELQKSLTSKGEELKLKNDAANAKLKQMLTDQNQAEKEKVASEQLQAELAIQMKNIEQKQLEVQKDLSEVEPAVNEAKSAVEGIRKQQIVELKSMQSPPSAVKLAMESLLLLIGENVGTDWKAIRGVVVKDGFINRILQFDTDSIKPNVINEMEKFKNNPDWEFEKVNRASTACGPLLKWVKAQLLYSDMLHKVEPLRNELKRLKNDASSKAKRGEELKNTVAELEKSIAAYKEEYALLIEQTAMIKKDLEAVQEKVGRSIQLLSSLRSESERWNQGCENFDEQMNTVVGDATLSAAFLAYSGYYDQALRNHIFNKWSDILETGQIKFRSDLARIEYLSSADDRLQWNNNGLPKDDLCTENAIMLQRFNRYPLIIDPSGQAVDYLMKQFETMNITKTSFLDKAFKKNLETALRFGTTLLVQDVESYDPILNPVLNNEIKRAAGRVLITLGDQDIDLSPAFRVFLLTRDPSVEFPPDLCSRVTFVNFTITPGSLETQCLHKVLKSERPDIDEKRNDLLKLQGEFAVRLRQLEKALLSALNESKGKILDDDSVISTLEKLKKEAEEVARKSAETNEVMAEVDKVSHKYANLASACSLIYVRLHQLCDIHFLYHYSLDFIIDIFTTILQTHQLTGISDYDARLKIITNSLFQIVYRRVSQGMLHADKILLALVLLRIYLKYDFADGSKEIETKLENLLREVNSPDRLLSAAHILISEVFGQEFMLQDKVTNLQEILESEVTSRTAVMLASVTGFDASNKIEDLAIQLNREVTSIAIGSSEGFQQAEKAIDSASKSARWVLLKNVHLAPSWLTHVEKRLHVLRPHPQFRLIYTAEIHPKLPVSVLQASRLIVFEPATGLKANLLRSLSSIGPARIGKAPAERSRLYFLVCWFHALVQDRLRYRPLGWAHSYEFSDADLRMACDTLDVVVDSVAMGRKNVSADKLPWKALRTLFSQCIYGGKIDNRFDQILLDCFLQKLFTPKAFDSDFVLINNLDGNSSPLCMPDVNSRDQMLQWVSHIQHLQIPNWIGLPNNAEKVLLADRGHELLRNLLKMSDEDFSDSSEKDTHAPSWMLVLTETATRWLQLLPQNLSPLLRTKENIKDPLFRFFEREVLMGMKLLADVKFDLNEILSVCKGEIKLNNHLRTLTSALNKGIVPASWNRYTVPASITAMEWMNDFVDRVKQLGRLGESPSLRDEQIWLGGLFAPEAYFTATRQMIAQSNGWSLEQLTMHVRIGSAAQPDAFTIKGLRIVGASIRSSNRVSLIDEVHSDIDLVNFSWTLDAPAKDSVPLPVYLYGNRSNLLATFDFIPENFEKSLLYERGVALACNSFRSA